MRTLEGAERIRALLCGDAVFSLRSKARGGAHAYRINKINAHAPYFIAVQVHFQKDGELFGAKPADPNDNFSPLYAYLGSIFGAEPEGEKPKLGLYRYGGIRTSIVQRSEAQRAFAWFWTYKNVFSDNVEVVLVKGAGS